MSPLKTYRLDRLYFKFLRPQDIPTEKLDLLATKLYEAGFIELYQSPGEPERYAETEKLSSRQNRDELFKLIQGVKHA